jgi:hypothetical protein
VTPGNNFTDFLLIEHLLACILLAGKIIDSKKVWFKIYTKKMVALNQGWAGKYGEEQTTF